MTRSWFTREPLWTVGFYHLEKRGQNEKGLLNLHGLQCMDCVSMLPEQDGARWITPGTAACMVTITRGSFHKGQKTQLSLFLAKGLLSCSGGCKGGGVMGEASVLLRDMDWLHDKAWDPLAGSNHNCFLETKELCLLKTTHFHERSRSFH